MYTYDAIQLVLFVCQSWLLSWLLEWLIFKVAKSKYITYLCVSSFQGIAGW